MSFSKINNSFNIYNLPSKNLRSFKAADNSDNLPNKEDIDEEQIAKKISDDEIYALSAFVPDKKMSKVAENTMKAALVTIPIVDTVVSSAVKKGNLSAKLKYGVQNTLRWGSVIAAGLAVTGAKAAINSKVKPLDDFDKKHPVVSKIIDFAAMFTAYDFFNNGIKTSAVAFKELFPGVANSMNKKVYAPVKNFLNNSFVNRKIVQPAEKFVEKRYYLGRANKFAAFMAAPAMFVAAFVRCHREEKNRNEQVNRNMNFLYALNEAVANKAND